MRAAIVLLADDDIQNYARRLVAGLHIRHGVRFYAAALPCHVSLKQPFAFDDLATLDAYVGSLAASTAPLPIELPRVYYGAWPGWAILGLEVIETPALRALHNRLNAELAALFGGARADHDGEGYRFHLTCELGEVAGDEDPFKAYYDSLEDKSANLRFTAEKIGLFLYADGPLGPGSFFHYRTVPLGGRPSTN